MMNAISSIDRIVDISCGAMKSTVVFVRGIGGGRFANTVQEANWWTSGSPRGLGGESGCVRADSKRQDHPLESTMQTEKDLGIDCSENPCRVGPNKCHYI